MAYGCVAEKPETFVAYHLAESVTIILAQGKTRGLAVHPSGLKNEADLFERGVHGKIIYHRLVQTDIIFAFGCGFSIALIKQDNVPFRKKDKIGVGAGNDSSGTTAVTFDIDFDMKI